MAYDEHLAARVRKSLQKEPGYSEKKMFGGICFLLDGHMCCGVVGPDLMVRVGKHVYYKYIIDPHARPMTFTGKEMKGMLFVGPGGVETGSSLAKWLRRAKTFVATLPPRSPKPRGGRRTAARSSRTRSVPDVPSARKRPRNE